MAKTGGHLGSSLGVVELTVALHHVFNTPEDKIIWDVGHQVLLNSVCIFGGRQREGWDCAVRHSFVWGQGMGPAGRAVTEWSVV